MDSIRVTASVVACAGVIRAASADVVSGTTISGTVDVYSFPVDVSFASVIDFWSDENTFNGYDYHVIHGPGK